MIQTTVQSNTHPAFLSNNQDKDNTDKSESTQEYSYSDISPTKKGEFSNQWSHSLFGAFYDKTITKHILFSYLFAIFQDENQVKQTSF